MRQKVGKNQGETDMSGSLYGQKAIRKTSGAAAGLPVGTILQDAGRIPPPGFLGLCIGSPVVIPVAGYPQLVSRTWCGEAANNEADFFCRCTDITGSTKDPAGAFFILPDMSRRFVRGRYPNEDVRNYQYQEDATRNITGSFSGYDQNSDGPAATGAFKTEQFAGGGGFASAGDTSESWTSFDISRVVPVAEENRPINAPFNWIIKAFDEAQETAQADLSYLTHQLNSLTEKTGSYKGIKIIEGSATLEPDDAGKLIFCTPVSSGNTITLPFIESSLDGQKYRIKMLGTFLVTIRAKEADHLSLSGAIIPDYALGIGGTWKWSLMPKPGLSRQMTE